MTNMIGTNSKEKLLNLRFIMSQSDVIESASFSKYLGFLVDGSCS